MNMVIWIQQLVMIMRITNPYKLKKGQEIPDLFCLLSLFSKCDCHI